MEVFMDYKKIGHFIMTERKANKLTQAKLAEKLFVSEKTISKWENGKGLPDTSVLPKLCEILQININELLNGEKITKENYECKAEEKILELQKIKEANNKRFLQLETVIIILSLLFLFAVIAIVSFIAMPKWLKIFLTVFGTLICIISSLIGLKIEQVAGFYECRKCHQKYLPTYKQINLAMHIGRTRYMKCPHCHKRSWNKKVIK